MRRSVTTMTPRIAYAALWLALAAATLALVVHGDHTLAAALTAWAGGLVTYRLADLLRTH